MGLPRSTYYDAAPMTVDDAKIVAAITTICDEFETYTTSARVRHGRRRRARAWP